MKIFIILLIFSTNLLSKENDMKKEEIFLAGGCFWGMEELIRKQAGVLETEVGYSGGTLNNPSYEIVKTGTTNHAESIKITIDTNKTTYKNILLYFFKIHDPTTLNRQGNDIGTQYRSAIFYTNDIQKKIANEVKSEIEKSNLWNKPITTQIVKFENFYKAEEYHQDYLQKHPTGYTCHFER